MQLVLERRAERSTLIAVASPLIAIALTLITISILFAILGKNPIHALQVYFLDPLLDPYTLSEIAVKASPLVMIGVGLSLCYLANVWNIGAEGQFVIGAVCGSWLAVVTQGTGAGPWVLPAMLVAGRARRRALRADPGAVQGALRGERNPHQPHAGLCRRTDPRLSGARAVARSERLQLSHHRRFRPQRHGAGAVRRQPRARRLPDHACRGGGGGGDAGAHHQGLRNPRGRRRAQGGALCRLQVRPARHLHLHGVGRARRALPASSRWPGRSGTCSRASRRATASPPSSSPSSAGSIRSASLLQGCSWRSPSSAAKARRFR